MVASESEVKLSTGPFKPFSSKLLDLPTKKFNSATFLQIQLK